MDLQDLKEKLVAVLGYGQEGKAVTAYLMNHGIKPVIFDQKPWDKWPIDEQEAIKKLEVNFIFGPDTFLELKGFDVAFRSPGIPLSNLDLGQFTKPSPQPSSPPTLKLLRTSRGGGGLQVTSQTKWFFEHCPAKIIGVTGTKGKGTTASLIYEILKKQYPISNFQYPKVHLTGNIGKVQPLEILDDLIADDFVVYELSSFQLQDLKQSPHIAVVLMTTTEHLDYHKDIKEYHEAKTSIARFQTKNDFSIINQDFPASKDIGSFGKGKKLYFSKTKPLKAGCFVKDKKIILGGSNFQFPISKLQLKGRHNLENVCASVLAAKCAGARDAIIKSTLKNFQGLEHRLEFVAEKNGIKFYNDSFSTTPETTIAAMASFTEPEILILGGSSKNSDFRDLTKRIVAAKNLKSIIFIGNEGLKIKDMVAGAAGFKGQILEGAKDMAAIFHQIKSVAKKGDVVLLSPACASFDMFKSYVDRGVQFKKFVKTY